MTNYNKTTLKTYFETGDVPDGSDYANLIDSQVNLSETTEQQMAGALNTTELITPRVSATNIIATTISAATGNFSGGLEVQGNVSAGRIFCSATCRASAINLQGGAITNVQTILRTTGIVSAAGTAQAAGAQLIYSINFGAGVVDGQTTGFVLPANQQGNVQYVINGAASANLWPCVGGSINVLASNAAFAMAANTLYTIVHTKASGYAVK